MEKTSKSVYNKEKYMKDINLKLSLMKNSKYRTTNFSIIEYFVENNFEPLDEEELITKILKDYKSNPNRYVLSKDKVCFKSERSFKQSIKLSISKNKAFIKGPEIGDLSLNLEKAVQYLKTMYKEYISNSSNVQTPYKIFKNRDKTRSKKGRKSLMSIKEKNKESNNMSMDMDMGNDGIDIIFVEEKENDKEIQIQLRKILII